MQKFLFIFFLFNPVFIVADEPIVHQIQASESAPRHHQIATGLSQVDEQKSAESEPTQNKELLEQIETLQNILDNRPILRRD